MNWIYPLYICEFLLFFLAFFLSKKDIMAPSVIMCVMFILSTTVAILAADQVKIKYGLESFEILIAGISTFIIAEALFQRWFQRKVTPSVKMRLLNELQKQPFYAVHIQGWLIVVAILIDVPLILWYLREMMNLAGGFGGAVRSIVAQTVVTSWDDQLINPLLGQLMKVVKALGYIAGFVLIQRILAKEKKPLYTAGLLTLMGLGLVSAFISASRGEVLQFLSALLAEYNILWHQKNGWNRNLSWKLIRIGLICIVVGIPVFYYSVVWMGRTAMKDLRTITEATNIYVGYPIYLFDLYVKDPSVPVVFGEESLIGVNTFLSKFLGMDVFVRSNHLEYHYSNGHFMGNVYTFFRRPLHDFGFGGMLVFTILVALLFSWLYYGKIKWKPRTVGTDCWSLIYGHLFYWIVLSSIDQYSQSYVSINVFTILLIIAVGYHLLSGIVYTSTGFKYRKSRRQVRRRIRIGVR